MTDRRNWSPPRQSGAYTPLALENGKFSALHLEEEHNTIKWVHAITNEHTTIEMEILNMI